MVALVAAWGVGLLLTAAAVAAEPALVAPAGFRVRVFASGLGAPRAMTVDPVGTLLVSVPAEGRVLALPDRGGRGQADEAITVLAGLERPHGLAFRDGDLYVAETGRVVRFRYDAGTVTARDPVVIVPDLPAGAHHWTRSIAFGPDGRMYVAVGSSCDICREQDPRRAAIVRYERDGSAPRLFATGLRNPVGLAFHPGTGALWTTVNERDWQAGGAPADYVTEVTAGAWYGWPDCFAARGLAAPDPELPGRRDCRTMALPTVEIPPHSAPLGLAFYTGRQYPRAFHGSLLVAYHGSRAGLPRAGYRVVRITLSPGQPPQVEDFITGWAEAGQITGRPVDLVVGADGALYVSDDHGGRIFRVSFRP
jgi:glucose/arabinose dehydrogenase